MQHPREGPREASKHRGARDQKDKEKEKEKEKEKGEHRGRSKSLGRRRRWRRGSVMRGRGIPIYTTWFIPYFIGSGHDRARLLHDAPFLISVVEKLTMNNKYKNNI